MDPFSHFYIALLPLTLYIVVRYRRIPKGTTILLLFVATQLPDIVDKSLAWGLRLTPSGRMVAHSVVVSLFVLTGVLLLAARIGKERAGVIFSLGYSSHLAADLYPVVYLGREYYFFPNMFWPLLEPNPDRQPSFRVFADQLSVLTALLGLVTVFVLVFPLLVQYRRSRTGGVDLE